MGNTVVSIFENAEQAENARNVLRAAGCSDDQVTVKTAIYKSDPVPGEEEEKDILEKIGDFFKDLFGAEDEELTHYTNAGHKGTIITVHTADRNEAEKVAAILDGLEISGDSESGERERHPFLDDPSNPVFENGLSETRSSRLRSRIVERSLRKNNALDD
jgi:hypothetical protein